MELKDTILLPKTAFAMRANLVVREPERLAHWEKTDLYGRIQKKRAGAPSFVLHDGPPFTNGDVHIGTALNKLLKDMVLRAQSMKGFATPYVPGWDCHGLPIEHKVSKLLREKHETLDTAALRKACADFSESYIEKQRKQFKRLGVLADWANEYKTKDPAYEAVILRTFAAFVEKGLVYRSKKPVYWSIPCETALAEAEIEYKDHTSPSIWVKFPVPADQAVQKGLPTDKPLFVVIWTTTPWTLPANMAVAVHPQAVYEVIDAPTERYLVARQLGEDVRTHAGLPAETPSVAQKTGAELEGLGARHPFIDRVSPVVLADYVTMDSGTGAVHTAPGHGPDDYLTGLRYKIDIYCPLDDKGRYVDDGKMPAELVGVSVLETNGKCPANEKVLEIMKARGALLALESLSHQYPYCWRSKTPVIFRAMDQWFVSLDKDGLREKALGAIGGVKWIPAYGEKRIRGSVEARPDWCISRQRAWGMPIPAFYTQDGEAFIDADVIRQVADRVEKEGTQFWFEEEAPSILSGMKLPQGWDAAALRRGTDTLDVWIDSGCSHRAVLQGSRPGLPLHWPADIYLEGSDQHRGWFQSSLWTAMIADGAAPYKTVVTHGFIVDEQKRKISKSDGKPQTADSYVATYGADVIRLWLASEDFRSDITLSDTILNHVVNTYRTVRNTFMYLLGNLADFDAGKNAVPFEKMDALDRWALHQLGALIEEVTADTDALEFHRAVQKLENFCGVTLSRVYHDILKDRLYTLGTDDPLRRSAQTAMREILHALLRLFAPFLPVTTDEAYAHAVAGKDYLEDDSIHLQDWPAPGAQWRDGALAAEFDALLKVRSLANEQLEALRKEKKIGKALEAKVAVYVPAGDPALPVLEKYSAKLPELFIVSDAKIVQDSGSKEIRVEASPAEGVRCPRCWRVVPALESSPHADVCPRCAGALRPAS